MPGVLVLALQLTGSAPPQPSVELIWDAPAGCPAQDALERQLAAMPMNAPARPPRVAFRVERRGDRWHLIGEISGTHNNGQRELDAATCDELAEAAVLLTAIAIDPDLRRDEDPVVPPPAPVIPPPTQPTTAPTTVPKAADDPPPEPSPAPTVTRRQPSALLGLAAGLGLGALPAPAGLLRLTLGLRGERWSVALAQDFWLPRTIEAAGTPEVGGRFWLTSTGLRGCGILRAGTIEFPLCAMLAAGVMFGQGLGALSPARHQRSFWLAMTAGPGLRVPLGRRLGLLVNAELLGVLAPPRFEITGRGELCCSARIGGQFTGGFELRLP